MFLKYPSDYLKTNFKLNAATKDKNSHKNTLKKF